MYIEGSRPERCISSMIYSGGKPFRSETLDMNMNVKNGGLNMTSGPVFILFILFGFLRVNMGPCSQLSSFQPCRPPCWASDVVSSSRATDLGFDPCFPYQDFSMSSHTSGFHRSPRLCPSTAGCSPPSMSSIVLCLFAFLFHLSPWLCPSTAGCSPPSMSSIVLCLFAFLFHLSPWLCPSTAGCSPPSMSSIVFCLLLSCSRWFPPSLLCRLAILDMVVPFVSSLFSVVSLWYSSA